MPCLITGGLKAEGFPRVFFSVPVERYPTPERLQGMTAEVELPSGEVVEAHNIRYEGSMYSSGKFGFNGNPNERTVHKFSGEVRQCQN